MNGRRALAVVACGGLSLLPACDPCEGARVRVLGSDGEAHLEACAEVAVTEEDRRRGLAGRAEMEEGEGLWMEFPVVGEVCITGEGMWFALDVVMVDGGGRVAEIGALGEGDPRSICVPGIRSVLEVPAGAAASVRRGDVVESIWSWDVKDGRADLHCRHRDGSGAATCAGGLTCPRFSR